MKATGIVRRIDDLGRVVIPKEIRRTLRIREGDPLEIFTSNDGEVIFKKYSPIGELSAFAAQYADILHKTSGKAVIVCDRDHVVADAGVPKRSYWSAAFPLPSSSCATNERTMSFPHRSIHCIRLRAWNAPL